MVRKIARGATWAETAELNSEPCPATGCWLWLGASTGSRNNYAVVVAKICGAWRTVRVHREIVAERAGRTLAAHEYACHRCDVSLCVNPDHLYLGDAATNSHDWHRRKHNGVISDYETVAAMVDGECVPNDNGCLIWPYAMRNGRTPEVYWRGTVISVHRSAWVELHGDPGDAVVYRACGEIRCCNVAHLAEGTLADSGRAKRERNGTMPRYIHPRRNLSAEFAALGLSRQAVHQRVQWGWTWHEATTTPRGHKPERLRRLREDASAAAREAALHAIQDAAAGMAPTIHRSSLAEMLRAAGITRSCYEGRRRCGYSHEQAITGIGVRPRGRPRRVAVEAA